MLFFSFFFFNQPVVVIPKEGWARHPSFGMTLIFFLLFFFGIVSVMPKNGWALPHMPILFFGMTTSQAIRDLFVSCRPFLSHLKFVVHFKVDCFDIIQLFSKLYHSVLLFVYVLFQKSQCHVEFLVHASL